MKLIIGLGNPGKEYTGTRHNFGWQALDFLAESFLCHSGLDNSRRRVKNELVHSSEAPKNYLEDPESSASHVKSRIKNILKRVRDDKTIWKKEKRFHAEIAKTNLDGEDIFFVKPQTFYNLSGQSVRAIRDFYKLDNADILVIHDDMDLPIGQLRMRRKGSAAGNNGIQSLIDHIGSDFARLRIGSGKNVAEHDGLSKPTENHRGFVLSRPNSDEQAKFEQLLPEIEQVASDFVAGKFAAHSLKI